ncbi:tetratricopeptide repeat protein [Paraburkholderia kururiensis]|uniref:Tetratricopeptide repeat protein n=1 Tax=Paraburkholderia kururiensis TaxID=984307 RepID=A0ABZ0WRD9_9BURK|nr:tetratricopeptide repeat protein [Paraburkholderia kururiensis]WQD79937.1 tetratricopeptide repeat protein [Paraburkholderia kururiensis]
MERKRERGGRTAQSHDDPTGGRAALMHAAVRSALQNGRALHDKGQIAQALELYRGVLAIDPDNAEAWLLFGAACDQCGDLIQAERAMARALRLERRYAWAFAHYGLVLVKLGRHEAALAPFEEALRLDSRHVPAHVGYGNALLGLGRHAEAQKTYEQALALSPGLAEAWSNRGNALRALGRAADALISFDRALAISPHNFATHTNRGHALRDLGRHEEALRSYRLALVIRPRVPELLSQCGTMLLALGRDEEALVCFDEALAAKPDDVDTLYRSCIALDLRHRYAELLNRCDRILSIAPNHAGARLGRANALAGLHRHTEAAEAYTQALANTTEVLTALSNQGVALRMLERYAEALDSYDGALERIGANAQLLISRGYTLQLLGRYDDALASFEAAAQVPPTDAAGWALRGSALQQLLRFDEAIGCYARMHALEPDKGHAHHEEAYCRLLTGDFAEGWKKYEYRWVDPDAARSRRHANRPFWSGREPIAGKTVLLHSEQGYGDTIQFCRYASLVLARGAAVVMEVPAALKTLLSSLQGVRHLVAIGEPLPAFDVQCPLLTLPLAFDTRLETIPADVPYLHADVARMHEWRRRLEARAPRGRLKVALAWSGNATHNNDMNRSVVLETLAPLLAQTATFVSLQPQVRERDAVAFAESGMLDFGPDLQDFADTAALVACLDLVIAVDTSVVHLAGALGKPVWVLLPRVPDWRWLLNREDSPWYPTARLFRQDKPGDWPTVVGHVAQALERHVKEWERSMPGRPESGSAPSSGNGAEPEKVRTFLDGGNGT